MSKQINTHHLMENTHTHTRARIFLLFAIELFYTLIVKDYVYRLPIMLQVHRKLTIAYCIPIKVTEKKEVYELLD